MPWALISTVDCSVGLDAVLTIAALAAGVADVVGVEACVAVELEELLPHAARARDARAGRKNFRAGAWTLLGRARWSGRWSIFGCCNQGLHGRWFLPLQGRAHVSQPGAGELQLPSGSGRISPRPATCRSAGSA